MFTNFFSSSVHGINSKLINIQVDISNGLIQWNIVGLPDTAVKESKQRISAAIRNSGIKFPEKKITINLSPADLKKEGSMFDLPITIALLEAAEIIKVPDFLKKEGVFIGEISLDGTLNGGKGVLIVASELLKFEKKYLILPFDKAEEAALVKDIFIIAPKNLTELITWFSVGEFPFYKKNKNEDKKLKNTENLDLLDVNGNENAKRALQIAAAGNHAILLIGSPGSGKTMLAERFCTLLPEMSFEEKIEVSKIYSSVGQLDSGKLLEKRPFQSPHHTISSSGLAGGGTFPKPGAITMAHKGVLFLDELLEYKRNCLEILRQPLESKKITISRANNESVFPADFLLIAATNPCPCGYYGDERYNCNCSQNEIKNYIKKLSGPLLDRIDLHVGVYSQKKFNEGKNNKSSNELFKEVKKAREMQLKRFGSTEKTNSIMNSSEILKYCILTTEAKDYLNNAYEKFSLSMRGYYKIIKISRTIADLENEEEIKISHLIEAFSYRLIDKILK